MYKNNKVEREVYQYHICNSRTFVTTEFFKNNFIGWNKRYHEKSDFFESEDDAIMAFGCIYYGKELKNAIFKINKAGEKKFKVEPKVQELANSNGSYCKINGSLIYKYVNGRWNFMCKMSDIMEKASKAWGKEPEIDYFFITDIPEEVIGNFDGEEIKIRPKENWGVIGGGNYNSGVQKNSSGRYLVAVGPKILNPNYLDSGKIWNDEFKDFNKNIDIYLKSKTTKETKIIKCYVNDFKAHTYSKFPDNHPRNDEGITASVNVANGLLQTGIAYPNSSNAKQSLYCSKAHFDGNIIEFCGSALDFKIKDYVLDKILVYKTK